VKEIASALMFVSLSVLTALSAAEGAERKADKMEWPTHGWAKDNPARMGLDETVLAAFDADLASGKYALVDSFEVFRCGKIVYERKYPHDYGQIYEKRRTRAGR
jgi:hypothetical protein